MPVNKRTATCSCGQLSAEVLGEPQRVSICHCLACQQRTGSVFGEQAVFAAANVTPSGNASVYVRVGDQGTRFMFRFCPTCGATVYYTAEGRDGVVVIPVGAFADPTFSAPTASFYESRKHAWLALPEGMKHAH